MRSHPVSKHGTSLPTITQLEQAPKRGYDAVSLDVSLGKGLRRAVFTICRKSSLVDMMKVKELEQRNSKLYDFVQRNVHPRLHAVSPNSEHCKLPCAPEHFPLVLNGVLSNTNISVSRQTDVKILRKCLLRLEAEPHAEQHFILRHLPPIKRCPVQGCVKMFTGGANLRNHLRVHNGKQKESALSKGFNCDQCDYIGWSAKDLEIHSPTHLVDRELVPCPNGCGHKMLDTYVYRHLKELCTLIAQTLQHECPMCGDVFNTSTSLTTHI